MGDYTFFLCTGIEIYVPTITSACIDRSNGMHRLNIQWKVSIHINFDINSKYS